MIRVAGLDALVLRDCTEGLALALPNTEGLLLPLTEVAKLLEPPGVTHTLGEALPLCVLEAQLDTLDDATILGTARLLMEELGDKDGDTSAEALTLNEERLDVVGGAVAESVGKDGNALPLALRVLNDELLARVVALDEPV